MNALDSSFAAASAAGPHPMLGFSAPTMIAVFALSIGIAYAILATLVTRSQKRARRSIVRLQLACDAVAASGLRDAVARAARDAERSSPHGAHPLAQLVLSQVQARVEHVRFASLDVETRLPARTGMLRFGELVRTAREIAARQAVRSERSDGSELLVVTLLMARNHGAFVQMPTQLGGAAEVRAALASMASVHVADHVAFDVVWAPADDGNGIGRDQMLTAFPTLTPL